MNNDSRNIVLVLEKYTCKRLLKGENMNKRTHKEEIVKILQDILACPNARCAAQHQLYVFKASLLTKGK